MVVVRWVKITFPMNRVMLYIKLKHIRRVQCNTYLGLVIPGVGIWLLGGVEYNLTTTPTIPLQIPLHTDSIHYDMIDLCPMMCTTLSDTTISARNRG